MEAIKIVLPIMFVLFMGLSITFLTMFFFKLNKGNDIKVKNQRIIYMTLALVFAFNMIICFEYYTMLFEKK